MNEIARETLAALDRGSYQTASGPQEIGAARVAAVAGTRLFPPADLASLATGGSPNVIVASAW